MLADSVGYTDTRGRFAGRLVSVRKDARILFISLWSRLVEIFLNL